MLILSALFAEFRSFPLAVSIFNGLQVIVVALTFNAAYSFGRGIKRDLVNFSFIVAAAILFSIGVSPFLVILLSALAGVILMKAEISPAPANNNKRKYWIHKGVWLLLLLAVSGLIVLFMADHKLFELATIMLQVDIFAFGGGFSSLPLMLQKVVNVHGWMSNRTFMDGIALGQITPGPIVITATFVGYILKGITGAVVATIAMFTPSFLVLVAVEPVFSRFRSSRYFLKAMEGVFACFVGLLLSVGIKFFLDVPWDAVRAIMGITALIALARKIDILYIVAIGTILSTFLL
jgi:chromate transporter